MKNRISEWLLGYVATLVVGYGAYSVYLGHDGNVALAVFIILGGIAGVPVGQLLERTKAKDNS